MDLFIPNYPGNTTRITVRKILSYVDNRILYPPKIHHIVDDFDFKTKVPIQIKVIRNILFPLSLSTKVYTQVSLKRTNTINVIITRTNKIIKIDEFFFYDEKNNIDHGLVYLATNEGFNNTDDFFQYFGNQGPKTILHWTRLDYASAIFYKLP